MLLEKYYFGTEKEASPLPSSFRTMYDTEKWRDKFYIFLQNIFHIAPTYAFHKSIWESSETYQTDKEIYEDIQRNLPAIKPFLADLRYGIPALAFQKKEIAQQARELL